MGIRKAIGETKVKKGISRNGREEGGRVPIAKEAILKLSQGLPSREENAPGRTTLPSAAGRDESTNAGPALKEVPNRGA